MTERWHTLTEPIDEGTLDVGDGHVIHWEVSGNPDGKPAVQMVEWTVAVLDRLAARHAPSSGP